jgi:2,3-bisphosphoglycerate-dependent phosphoglycerate mutase
MAVVLTLRLLRHGATDWSDAGRYTGLVDVSLNADGRAQADALKVAGFDYDTVLTSDLRRCVETAARAGVDTTREPALREFDFGEMAGLTWADLDPDTQTRLLDYNGFVAPGGESVSAFGARVEGLVDGLRTGFHLLVTHGGVIHHLLRREGIARHIGPGEWTDLILR